jgi:aldehyde:ferredoxin oxidoreductase
MKGGWVGKILEVDLTTGRTGQRSSEPYARNCLGGRALAAQLAWDELPPTAGVFDPENIVIIATGPLTGTLAPTAGRTIMTSLSPRIYPRPWYTHSTLGGWFGPALKYAGFDAMIVRGRSDRPVYLEVIDGKARLKDAGDLWGKDARETQLLLKGRYNDGTQILTIGPAGERLVRFATVQHAEENAAGHSGFGAVWGSKNLKAIAVQGTGSVPVADPQGLWEEVRRSGTYTISPNIGPLLNRKGIKPRPICSQGCTFNCFVSSYGTTVDGRVVPGQCIGGLGWMTENVMEFTYYHGGGVEVPKARNYGMCEEVTLHERCNSLGLDQWFRVVFQPWLIACEQRGIHEIRGYPIKPDDVFWFAEFMEDLAYRRGLGDLAAEDLRRMMETLKDELPADLIKLGHQLEFAFGFPAHREGRFWDAEPLPFWVISAMMYASESRDPTIGAHNSSLLTADFLVTNREVALKQFRKLAEKVWGDPELLQPTFENKSPVAIWSQNQHMLIDSLTMCDFAFPQLVRPFNTREEWEQAEEIDGDLDIDLRLLNAVTGQGFTREDLTRFATRGFTFERMLLARAGRHRGMEESLAPHFQLPCRDDGTLVDAAGFSRILDEYYGARGWDLATGWPTPQSLAALGLESAIPEMESLRAGVDALALVMTRKD